MRSPLASRLTGRDRPAYRAGVTDERARPAGHGSRVADDEALDAAQAEALSRAAREAVRQPADPRIERSFAHLGLVPDDDPEPSPRRATVPRGRTRRAAVPAESRAVATDMADEPVVAPLPEAASTVPTDQRPLLEAIEAWQLSTGDLRRRLDVVTWLLAALTVVIGLLAVVLILRGPG